jgi:hypothetical protein
MKFQEAHPRTAPEPGPPVGPDPVERVRRPWQHHRWTTLTFLHWPYDPEVVQARLPEGLTVDTFDGVAWVGLVPFQLDIRAPGLPFLAWFGRFVETNVRTYVRAEDGTRGIWFFSLDAQRLGAVVAARYSYRLPYLWSRMQLERDGALVTYESRRRWPGGEHPTSHVAIEIGAAYEPGELTDLDHFLTARWTLFSRRGRGGLARTQARHDAWPLRHARVIEVDDHLLEADGLPAPIGSPRALYSEGVEVRLGARRRVEA